MAVNDIVALGNGPFGEIGTKHYRVQASATTIKPGEPVVKSAGSIYVAPMATNKPVVGGDYIIGIAASTSTNTATAVGYVEVTPILPSQTWLIKPNVAASWDTQTEYNALIGTRVLVDLTSSTYTILASDSADYGCIVEYLEVAKYPGRVAFSFRKGVIGD